MKPTVLGAIAGACLMGVGPFLPAAYYRWQGEFGVIDKTWSYFEVSAPASLVILVLAGVSIYLALSNQVRHVVWSAVPALFICLFSKPSEVIYAYQTQMGVTGTGSGSLGIGWGMFVIGGGAAIAGIAGLFEHPIKKAAPVERTNGDGIGDS